ncbi:acridine resistance protein [Enterobacteria phage RB33]|uniref:Acridine resistance protein n=2 Tax=Enterobacteria phage RB32 TaxID=45406 RepID=A0A097J6U0_BPR32|nr:acridine resistance protein [Escherichia phage RB32]ABI95082.1 acridine resistance protein [Escherichia phage RB32]AIT74898.1 acridine resistance protein [Enterobacteria phage RB33]
MKFVHGIAFFCWSFLFVGTLVTGETSVFLQASAQGVLAVVLLVFWLLNKND